MKTRSFPKVMGGSSGPRFNAFNRIFSSASGIRPETSIISNSTRSARSGSSFAQGVIPAANPLRRSSIGVASMSELYGGKLARTSRVFNVLDAISSFTLGAIFPAKYWAIYPPRDDPKIVAFFMLCASIKTQISSHHSSILPSSG